MTNKTIESVPWPKGLGIQMGALYQNRTGQVLKVVSADCTENRVVLAPTELDWTGTVQEMQDQFQLIASYTTLEKEVNDNSPV